MRSFKQQFIEAKDVAKLQWKSFVASCITVFAIYMLSYKVGAGWASYAFIVPPSFVCAITALARVNDIGLERMGLRWELRRIGLIMAGAGSVMLLATPFLQDPLFPQWRAVIIMWGVALTWMTTPGHPPWDNLISGKYRDVIDPPGGSRLQRFFNRFSKVKEPIPPPINRRKGEGDQL